MDTPTAGRIVAALVDDGLVHAAARGRAEQVVAHTLAAPAPGSAPRSAEGLPRLVEVVAYLGAALVLAAGALFLAETWDGLGDVGRVGAMAVVAAVLGGAGLVARGDRATAEANEVRRRLAGVLLAGAAAAVGFGVALAIDAGHEGSYDIYWPTAIGGLVALALGVVGYRLASSAVGLLAILGPALVAAPTLATGTDRDEALWVGWSFLLVGLAWTAFTEYGAFAQRTVARSLGCSVAVFGAQFIALATDRHAVGYVLTGGLVVGAVLLYIARLAWPYLTAAVVGITFAVPEAVNDWSSGNLDVISGVLLTGITLLAASFAGYWLRREASD